MHIEKGLSLEYFQDIFLNVILSCTLCDGCYTCNGVRFEHGLIVKVFNAHSVSSTSVHIPTNLFFLFQHSHHPLLLASKFPQPVEWNFTEGEQVVVVSSRKQGIIKAIGVNAIEVEFCNGEGIMNVDDPSGILNPGKTKKKHSYRVFRAL